MQLHAGARRFGRDRRGLQAQPLGSRDVDHDVLAAGGEDRIVERLIARRLAHPSARKMFGHQRRQDADHHDVRAALVGLGLGGVEAGAYFGLQLECGVAGQWPWWNVEFDVVGAELGLIGRVGDRCQHLAVAHRGLILGVDEIALDLHAGQRPVELETGLGEHCFEHVEAQLHLAPVLASVRARKRSVLLRPHLPCAGHGAPHAGRIRTAGHHDLRAHQPAAQLDLDRRVGMGGKRSQRRRAVGAQRTDQAVVHERHHRRERQHDRQSQDVQR